MKKVQFLLKKSSKFFLSTISLLFFYSSFVYGINYSFQVAPTGNPQVVNRGNNVWQLTKGKLYPNYLPYIEDQYVRSAIWNQDIQLDLTQNFCIKFDAKFSKKLFNSGDDGDGADGIAFVLQRIGNTAIGGRASGIGYSYFPDQPYNDAGITPSFAVEFDTYYNGNVGVQDDSQYFDHISYVKWGNNRNSNNIIAGPFQALASSNNIETGKTYRIMIIWDATTKYLKTYFEDMNTPRIDQFIDLTTIFPNSSNNKVTWGFTAATGTSVNYQEVKVTQVCVNSENCNTLDLEILEVGGEPITDIYPEYTLGSFGDLLKTCGVQNVLLKANVSTGCTQVVWKKEEGGTTTVLATQTYAPFVLTVTPPNNGARYFAVASFNAGCDDISDDIEIIPNYFTFTMPNKYYVCAEVPNTLGASNLLINGISLTGNETDNGIDGDKWVTWEWTFENQKFTLNPDNYSNPVTITPTGIINPDSKYKLTATYWERFNGHLIHCTYNKETSLLYEFDPIVRQKEPVCNIECPGELIVDLNTALPKTSFTFDWDVSTDGTTYFYNDIYFNNDPNQRISDNPLITLPQENITVIYRVKITHLEDNCVTYASIPVTMSEFKILEVKGNNFCGDDPYVEWTVDATNCGPGTNQYSWVCLETGVSQNDAFDGGRNGVTAKIKIPGHFKVIVNNGDGCVIEKEFDVINKNFGCEISDLIPLTYDVDDNITTFKLKIKMLGGKPPFTITIDNPITSGIDYIFDNIYTFNFGAMPLTYPTIETQYTVSVTDIDGCTCQKNLQIVIPNFQAHEYYAVCKGESVQLKTFKYSGILDINTVEETTLGDYHIIWEPFDYLDNPIDNLEPIVKPDRNIDYTGTMFIFERDANWSLIKFGQKIENCTVEVIETTNDFVKELEYVQSSFYVFAYLNGLSPTTRIKYAQEGSGLDCGFLVNGSYKDNDCFVTGYASLTKFNDELNQVWSKKYFLENLTERFEIFSGVINLTKPPTISAIGVEKKIGNGPEYFAYGGFSSNHNQNKEDILLLRLNPTNGEINKSMIIKNEQNEEYNDYAIKAMQSKDLKYIYILALYKNTNNVFSTHSQSQKLTILKINSNDLNIDKAKIIENIDYNLSGWDLIEIPESELILVLGKMTDKATSNNCYPFILKLNSDLTYIDSKKYSLDLTTSDLPINLQKFENSFLLTGTAKNSSLLNPFLIKIGIDLLPVSTTNIGYFITDNSNNLNYYSSIITTVGNINLYLKHQNNNKISLLNTNYTGIDLNLLKQVYFEGFTEITNNGIPIECQNPILRPRSKLINQGFDGATFLTGVNCLVTENNETTFGKINDDYFFLKLNTIENLVNNPLLNCLEITSCSKSEISNLINSNVSFTITDLNLSYNEIFNKDYGPSFTINSFCSAPICNCDKNRIEVVIEQVSAATSSKCFFNLTFNVTDLYSSTCNISKVEIIDASTGSSLLDHNFNTTFTANSTFSNISLMVDTFIGSKTIIINYKDSNGNIICSTTRVITCACSCTDYQKVWDNLEFDFVPSTETPEECCYDLYIDNTKNLCSFKDDGILIDLPESLLGGNLTFTPDINSDWTFLEDDPNHKLILTRGSYQINGGERVKIGTICVKRGNESKTVAIKINNEQCTNEWKQDLGCVKSCCEYITITSQLTESTSSENECCYVLNVNIDEDISKCAANLKILIKYQGKVLQEINSLQSGGNSVIICIPATELKDLPQQFELTADFVTIEGGENVTVCSKILPTITKCITCCDRIHLSVTPEPSLDDGTLCCFNFTVTIEEDERCSGLKQIKIFDDFNNLIWKSADGEEFNTGSNTKHFCVSKDDFKGESTLKLNFKFYNQADEEFCADDAEINACNDIPTGCTPDYPEVQWDYGTGSFSFHCGDDENAPECFITYNFQYRHVKSGGTSLHRDIQITSFTYNPDCTCIDEAVAAMFQAILEKSEVITKFDIATEPNFPNGTTKCFNNFRLITSDCWHEIATTDGRIVLAGRCPSTVCCYSIYEVCYTKNGFGAIVPPITFNKLNNYFVPVNCTMTPWPPCVPNNCTKLSPSNSGQVPVEIRSAAKIGIDLNDKNSVQIGYAILQKNFENEFDIAIMNDMTGIVQVEFVGLLGNKVTEFQLNKDRKAFNETIFTNLNSGIYFLLLKVNEQIIGSKKVLIIK